MASIGFSRPPPILGDPMNQGMTKPRPLPEPTPVRPSRPGPGPLAPKPTMDPAQALQAQFGPMAGNVPPDVDMQRLPQRQAPIRPPMGTTAEIAPSVAAPRPMRPYQTFRDRGFR